MNDSPPPQQTTACVSVGGVARIFTLRIPQARREFSNRLPEGERLTDARVQRRMGLLIAGAIESVDGHKLSRSLRLSIEQDRAATKALLGARTRLLDHHRHQKVCLFVCPHCERGGVRLDLQALSKAHGVLPRKLADANSMPTDPFLAHLPIAHRRTNEMRCARAALVELSDSTRITFTHPIHPQHDAKGWRRWGQEGRALSGKEHWTYSHPGFRAVLRLALATQPITTVDRAWTPANIESLPASDVLFLDALYGFLWVRPISNEQRATLCCPMCGHTFLAALDERSQRRLQDLSGNQW